ncbi:enterobactin synthase subunit F [Mangrovibacter phragmitis]|uniref:enterobactin synthase subunit F n=1 Tax=Mangrovibacter phragmitis TaxID=1691903 RepID=UPI003369D9B6
MNLPLVAAQPGIWMAEKLSSSPQSEWSVAHYVELDGELDAALLSRAIECGLAQADTLHLRFHETDGEIWQSVDESLALPAPGLTDLRHEAAPHNAAMALMQQDLNQNLRVDSGNPLVYHHIYRVGDNRWYWYQRYHHLLVDGFSFVAITQHITAIYRALLRGMPLPASPFTPFADVVEEYQHYQHSEARRRDSAFWAQEAQQLPPAVSLSEVPLQDNASGHEIIKLVQQADAQVFNQLMQAVPGCRGEDIVLALVALWLGRLSGRRDYTAGFIFMRRMGSAALSSTGPVLNVLPLAVTIDPNQTLAELAQSLAGKLKKMRRHQRYDTEQILRDTGRVVSHEPLYGPVFNVKVFDYQVDMDGLRGKTHILATGPVKDLELVLLPGEAGGAFGIELLANAHRYQADSLSRHMQRLPLLLRQFAANPGLRCGDSQLLLDEEQAQLARINQTETPLPRTTLSELLARQANQTPDAPALVDAEISLSYREMREQVVALAHQLRQQGVRPGDCVAVALPRSVFLTLALHAIVEAGAAWLPLDTGYPDDRLHMMLEDARPAVLITTPQQQERFRHSGVPAFIGYDGLLPTQGATPLALSRPEHTAYIIFTSGSTGRPKGVMVGQSAIVNRLLWMQEHYALTANDVVAQKTPCSFDVSVWEFFWPFIAGAKLVMAEPDAHRDPEMMLQFFRHYGVTTTHFVPSMLAAFVAMLSTKERDQDCESLRQVFCSGEALPTGLCREWEQLTGVALHNLYGPTEAAVDVSWYPAYGETLAAVTTPSVPIGFPVWNTGLRVLDDMMQPVPVGVAGDLYITGVQLAQGYMHRPDLTASRFIADPFVAGERMYRTGDVARWLSNGAVEYLGRSDFQLKIRGQRIELGEIDAVLQSLPGVAQAVSHACVFNHAADVGGDARQLVGYLVAEEGCVPDEAVLLEQVRQQLPPHLVPVVLITLDTLPLSANGKLDRKALPLPQLRQPSPGRAPLPGTESLIAGAFAQLLGCEINDASADFFALGGHSLLAMRLAAKLSHQLGLRVRPGQIMAASTVEKLSEALGQGNSGSSQPAGFEPLLTLREGNGPALFCFHPASGFAWQFSVLSRYLAPCWSVVGVQAAGPAGPMQSAATLEALCEHHLAILTAHQPHGPYYLLGYSLGGTLAHALASRLEAQGETVAFLGLLDTWPPETQNWSGKDHQQPDPEVLEKIAHEREAFIAAQQGQNAADELFSAIEANYADAVRLLATARSQRFNGHATLFVADQTLASGLEPHSAWAPWSGSLSVYHQPCTHAGIITPDAFATIGPQISQLLGAPL